MPIQFRSVSRHAAPEGDASVSAYRRILCTLPTFGAETNRIEFAPGTAETDLPTHAPDQLRTITERLDRLLFGKSGSARVWSLVETLQAMLRDGETGRDRLAAREGVSVHQLARELSDLGTSFRDVMDLARQAEFRRLKHQGRSLAEIAHGLGYGDQAAFTRAFKRWFGTTPSRYEEAN